MKLMHESGNLPSCSKGERQFTYSQLLAISVICVLALRHSPLEAQTTRATPKMVLETKQIRPRNSQTFLESKLRHLRIENVTLQESMALVVNKTGLKCALEILPCKGVDEQALQKPISLNLRNVSLKVALERIVAQNPVFALSIGKDGLVRVFPKKSADDTNYIMTQRIQQYNAVSVGKSQAISELLVQLSNIAPNFKWYGRSGGRRDRFGQTMLLHMVRRGTTAREVLDTLSSKLNESWMASYSRERKLHLIGVGNEFGIREDLIKSSIIDYDGDSRQHLARLSAQSRESDISQRKLARFRITDATVPECVMLLGNTLGFRYAIEAIPTASYLLDADSGREPIFVAEISASDLLESVSLDVRDKPVYDIFDAIVAANPAYSWSISQGLVRFYPKSAKYAKHYLMAQPLPEVKITGVGVATAIDTLSKIINSASDTAEIKSFVSKTYVDDYNDPIVINYSKQNVSARKVLDVISAQLTESWTIMPQTEADEVNLSLRMNTIFSPRASVSKTAEVTLMDASDNIKSEFMTTKIEELVGKLAPQFSTFDMNGTVQRLSDLRGKKNLLLTFFPKCFTGGCANHLSSLRDKQSEFDALDTQILAVSVDSAEGEKGQKAFAAQWKLGFPLIPDTQRKLSILYGATQTEKQLSARMSVFIDKSGVVRFIDTDVRVHTHGADILAKIRELRIVK